MSLFVNDIFVLICGECKTLFKLELIAKSHKKVIRSDDFLEKSIYIDNKNVLNYVFKKYNFKNLVINPLLNINRNKYMKKLKKCYKLSLISSNISNSNMCKLKHCHTLDLSHTNITDDTVIKLKSCYELILERTELSNDVVNELKSHCKVTFSQVIYGYDDSWEHNYDYDMYDRYNMYNMHYDYDYGYDYYDY